MKGRKPNPTALNRLRGNPGKRAPNHAEPKIPAGVPSCPVSLDAEAKREWARITRLMGPARMLTGADRAVLTAYCRAWSLFVEADKMVQKFGPMCVSDKTGAVYQSPYVNQMTAAAKDMVRFSAELGITPSARSRIKAIDNLADDDDPLQLLMTRFHGAQTGNN